MKKTADDIIIVSPKEDGEAWTLTHDVQISLKMVSEFYVVPAGAADWPQTAHDIIIVSPKEDGDDELEIANYDGEWLIAK